MRPPSVSTWLGRQRIALATCGSTNDEAARLARAGAGHGTVVTASAQTSGRGRLGRTWVSPPGNLYVSAILRLPLKPTEVPPVTLALGVAVHDVLAELGAPVALKWPNDVVVAVGHPAAGKKIAGILVETQSSGSRIEAVIAGIGIDLVGPLPDELAPVAVTVSELTGASPLPAAVLERLLLHVETCIDHYIACGVPGVARAWESRMFAPARLRLVGEADSPVGVPLGLDGDGALRVDVAGTIRRVRAGEVMLEPSTSPQGF